jgi:hypothetical protein
MLVNDFIDEIDFSVQVGKHYKGIQWKKLIEKVKGKKKSYLEEEYAFGIYQISPVPTNKKNQFTLSPSSEFF